MNLFSEWKRFSVGVVARSQYLQECALLRHKIDELKTDSVMLIARAS